MTSEPTPPADETDADLMERMAAGDCEALAALFRRHRMSVYRFSAQMTGSRDAAEDVTQEVFVALARNRGRYDPGLGSLSTYLYGIARHVVLQRRKRSRSASEVDIDSLGGDEMQRMAAAIDPLDDLSRAQRVLALRRAIVLLPVHYREVVVLCELNGVSYEEAARIVGCPAGTIRSRLHRGRRLLIERCRAALGTSTESHVRSWLLHRRSGTLPHES